VPPDQIVSTERLRQVDLSEKLERSLTDLTAKQQQLDNYLATAPDKNKTIAELQAARTKAETELATLKAESTKMRAELKELKERQAMEDAIMKGSRPAAKAKP
jgi:peptidoglycan hydrolase CwlO-like protein